MIRALDANDSYEQNAEFKFKLKFKQLREKDMAEPRAEEKGK